jgi:1,4-alpha-glucan branching enzyme
VINSGSWQNWQKDGWTLSKTGAESFQLHKKLMLFDKVFDFSDKFSIDISYWNFPVSERLKQGSSEIVNQPVRVDYKGNVTFSLKGKNKAQKVILSGSFNHWNEQALRMVKDEEGWKLTLQMPPGIYEYKYIVDGEWMTDPANPFAVQNQHYTYNSILVVGKEMDFFLPGFQNAKRVALSGSFNNWDKTGVPMQKTKNGWRVKQKLPPGKHYYKFIINNHDWITDPVQPLQEKDAEGNVNSVIIVH